MKVNERAMREAIMEFRYTWPWFNQAWNEHRAEKGITDLAEMPTEPFEVFLETYLSKAK